MKATLTSKGQITIPISIRKKLRLHTGDVLDFDETATFLKASKSISAEAWENFGKQMPNVWGDLTAAKIVEELRGPVELPPRRKRK